MINYRLLAKDRNAELEQRERQINRISAEAERSRPNDHCGWLPGRYWRAGAAESSSRGRKQRDGHHDENHSKRQREARRKKWEWPGELDERSDKERCQVDERWANDTQMRDVVHC
jgi:hypothetical protein